MTFKEYVTGFHKDQREKMERVKKAVAKALKVLGYKVIAYRAHHDGEFGKRWVVAYKMPEDWKQDEFYLRMFHKLVKRELEKEFDKWKLESVDFEEWDGQPTAAVRFFLPDGDGLLP